MRNKFSNQRDKVNLELSFKSKNVLEGKPAYFKDDLESLMYIAIYFLKEEPPWSKIFDSILGVENECSPELLKEIND